MVGSTKRDQLVGIAEVVDSGLAAQGAPLHMHLWRNDAALGKEQLLIGRRLSEILQRQTGTEQHSPFRSQPLERESCTSRYSRLCGPLRQAHRAQRFREVSAIDNRSYLSALELPEVAQGSCERLAPFIRLAESSRRASLLPARPL